MWSFLIKIIQMTIFIFQFFFLNFLTLIEMVVEMEVNKDVHNGNKNIFSI